MADPNNPFQIIMKEKMNAGKTPMTTNGSGSQEESGGWRILKIVGIIFLVLILIVLMVLAIWALTVAYRAESEATQAAQSAGQVGPAGQNGQQGPMGPQGPPGTFYFVGLGSVSGIYTGGCIKVANDNKITIPCTDSGFLIFDKRLPETSKLTDGMGSITIGQDGVYVVYATLDLNINDSSNPVIVRVYRNNIIFGYYEFYQSGSQSFTFANDYKLGDQIKISICSEADNNELITHGSFISILGS